MLMFILLFIVTLVLFSTGILQFMFSIINELTLIALGIGVYIIVIGMLFMGRS